jgi:hypothetical protein
VKVNPVEIEMIQANMTHISVTTKRPMGELLVSLKSNRQQLSQRQFEDLTRKIQVLGTSFSFAPFVFFLCRFTAC